MEIYHGGYTEIREPVIIKGRFTKDFGEGFYCTALKEQAIKWSLRYSTPVVSVYCTEKALKCLTFMKSEIYGYDGQRR